MYIYMCIIRHKRDRVHSLSNIWAPIGEIEFDGLCRLLYLPLINDLLQVRQVTVHEHIVRPQQVAYHMNHCHLQRERERGGGGGGEGEREIWKYMILVVMIVQEEHGQGFN